MWWANYKWQTDQRYIELQSIIREFNEFISQYETEGETKIPLTQTMKVLIFEFKGLMDQIIELIPNSEIPERIMEFYKSISINKKRYFVKLYPDNYRFLLAELSGPAARLYLAFKLYERTYGPDMGTCFVSREKLADDLKVSVKWVEKYIRQLKNLGLLRNLAPRGSRRNNWEIG